MKFPGYEEAQRRTLEALRDPRPGDRFHEMYSFWVYVVAVHGNRVVTLQANPSCQFPGDGKRWEGTRGEFLDRWLYGGTSDVADKPTVLLADRDNDVTGWAERAVS